MMFTAKTTGGVRRHTPNPEQQPLLLSVPQAARLLGVGLTLCWDMVHSGELPSVRLGRRVLIPRAVVEHLASVGSAGEPQQDIPVQHRAAQPT